MRESGIRDLSPQMAMLGPAAEALVSDGEEAVTLFDRAVTTPGAEQFPFALARVRLCYGEALRRMRQLVAARRQLSATLELFEQLGAAHDRAADWAAWSPCIPTPGCPRTPL